MLLEQRLQRGEPLVPHVARVPEVALLLELLARQRDALRVHDDDAIATVYVRREGRLVLAPQDLRHATGQAAERLPSRVDHEPAALHVLRFQRIRLHRPRGPQNWQTEILPGA